MSEQGTASAAGGWQPDPTGRHEMRYWDGAAWTDQVSDQGTASTDPLNASAPAVAPGYVPATAGARGQIGTPSPVGKTILLTIVTLGIYGIIWLYRQQEELKQYSGEGIGGVLAVVIALVFGVASPFILANEVQKNYEREGQQSPIKTIEGLWILIPLVGMLIFYLKAQKAITDFWVARGATPV